MAVEADEEADEVVEEAVDAVVVEVRLLQLPFLAFFRSRDVYSAPKLVDVG